MHYYWSSGWDWLWMSLMMGFWAVVVAAAVFFAVRLAQRPRPPERQG